MKPYPFADKLSLWGVDRPPVDPDMLLDFIQKMGQNLPLPPRASTLVELDSRRAKLQTRLRHSLGLNPWPLRTDLNVRIVGILEKPGYKIEKVVYEAWAGLQVTAHLYLPDNLTIQTPGLLYACGHWMEAGKLAIPIQSFCAAAATLGIITLVYDPIGQGERMESWQDHGNLAALLVGQCQLGWMVWESIRALDYLLSRPEVDPKRIAMTGASGGGLNTLFTTAIDERFTCAIPVAYPCTFLAAMLSERDLNWEDGTDVCNQVPQIMSYAEMSDIASLFIPKPYMILSGKRDRIFPISGVRKIAAELEHNYRLASVPERFHFEEFDEDHGYQLGLRQAAYGWLKQWLLGDGNGSPIPEPVLNLLPDPYPVDYMNPPVPTPGNFSGQSPTSTPDTGALAGFCLPLVRSKKNNAKINERIQDVAVGLNKNLPLPASTAGLMDWQDQIRQGIRAILGPFPQQIPLQTRLVNQVWGDGLMAERISFESEEGITIPGLLILPAQWERPLAITVYIGEWGKNQGLQSGIIDTLVQSGYGVLAIDVRGVGETATSDFEAATNSLMMDRPLFGQRVLDVIRAVDFIWERCYIAPQIDKGKIILVGEGVGGLWGLYAAALDRRVAAVVAKDTIYSYLQLINTGTQFPAGVYLFDVLSHFDLVHVIASCAPRPVYLSPVNGKRKPVSRRVIKIALKTARIAYSLACAHADCLQITSLKHTRNIPDWLDRVLSV